jgi:ribosomal protein S13
VARIAGINIPLNKHIVIALTSIFGIGDSRAKQICEAAGVAPETPVKDLAEPEVAKLRTAVANFTVEGDLRGVSARALMPERGRARVDRSRDKESPAEAGSNRT